MKLTKYQLPPKIVQRQSIYPLRQILLLVNIMFCKYPLKFCTYVQNASLTWKFIFFFLSLT